MPVDQLGDVVALQRNRKPGEWTRHRDARRERLRVVVDLDRFLPPGHHRHADVAFAKDGTLRPQRLEVGVWVVDEPVIPEEVDLGEVGHCGLLRSTISRSENVPLTIEYYISTAAAPRQSRQVRRWSGPSPQGPDR